jgi:hypothetical protein
MLDIQKFLSIIYIWYEGGALSPPVVTARAGRPRLSDMPQRRRTMAKKAAKGAKKKAAKKR